MSKLVLKVKVQAGADIQDIVEEMIEKAQKLDMMISTNFNGYPLNIPSWTKLNMTYTYVQQYKDWLKRPQ